MSRTFLYTGSWGNKEQKGTGEGVSAAAFNSETGEMTLVNVLREVEDPGILAVSLDSKYVYSINEGVNFKDIPASGGGISAMKIDPETGALSLINQTHALGSLPCYLTVDPTGQYVCAAIHGAFEQITHYRKKLDGTFELETTVGDRGLSLFKVGENGGVAPCDLWLQYEPGNYPKYMDHPESINRGMPGRSLIPLQIAQNVAYVHSINFTKDGLGIVCDRGCDKIYLFTIDRETNRYRKIFTYDDHIGVAPRHTAVHPNDCFFYMTHEIESSVSVFRIANDRKSFEQIQVIATLPADSEAPNAPSDIHVDPNGRFVYASNRFDDSIACYRINQATGMLTMIDVMKLGEPQPRGFAIDPSGKFLVVGNMDANRLVCYTIDQETGKLSPTGYDLPVNSPTCVVFAELD